MRGNLHVRFLGGCGRATACTYPTLPCVSGECPACLPGGEGDPEDGNRVTTRLGTSTAEMIRIFVAQIADTGKVPLNLALLRAFPSALSIHAGRANRQTGERREQMSSSRFPSVLLLPVL